MATFRVGVGSFNIEDKGVGFGTSPTDGLGNLKVKGVTKTTGSIVSGASTLTRYSGFAADNINQLENITLTSEVGTIGDIVVGVGTSVIISSGSTVTVGTVESVSIGTHFSPPVGGIEERGQDFIEGMMRFNTDLNTLEFYNGNEWRQFNYQSDITSSPSSRGRGILAGGYDPLASASNQDHIGFINIASEGNALDFGNLITGRQTRAASSSTRGLIGCGYISPTGTNIIEYITMASAGNGIDFGDATIQRRNHAMLSSSTRAIMGGGESPSQTNVMDYVEIATLGNALDFGDLNGNRVAGGGMASPVRGIIHGNELTTTSQSDEVEMITIASKGNSVRFGSMDDSRRNCGSVSNGIRGLVAGGQNGGGRISLISFCTMASEGDFVSFGDLSGGARDSGTGMCNSVRAIFTAGYPDHAIPLESINFASGGQAVTFGFDTMERGQSAGYCSDSHGGLGGY